MISINLKPEIEAQIKEKAQLENLTLEQYIESLIEKEITAQSKDYFLKDSAESASSIEDWEDKLLEFVNSPLDSDVPPLEDEAISRENIYTREDQM